MSIDQGVAIWIHYKAWDPENAAFKSGDVANHVLQVVKDGVMTAATNTPQEVGAGVYRILLTATEVNGLFITLHGISNTADIYIIAKHMITRALTRGESLVVQYTAWDMDANAPKTGDAGNHTLNVAQANSTAAADNSPSEVDASAVPGLYSLILEDTETTEPIDSVYGTSSTADVVIMPTTFPTGFQPYYVDTDGGDSIRQQIIDVLIARFATILIANGYKTDLGNNVTHWRSSRSDVATAKLPHLSWEDSDEDEIDETLGEVDHFLEITCKISAQSIDDVYDARADLIQAIGSDLFMSGLAGNTTPPVEQGDAIQQSKETWGQEYKFVIEYGTLRFDEYTQ